jgi:hypothetical protein
VSTPTRNFLDDLSSAVQANPVPAALIGMGALWMLMGGGRTSAAAAFAANGAARVADSLAPLGGAVASGAGKIGETVSDLAAAATETVGQALGSAGEAVGETAGRIGASAADVGSSLRTQSAQAGTSASALAGTLQGNLAETFERQPLLVGLIGLAIGAAVATAVPTTRIEEEMIGEQAGAAKEKLEDLVAEQAENLGAVASRTVAAVKEEAQAQGLTPAALKEGVAAVRDKAVKAASTARRTDKGAADAARAGTRPLSKERP